MPHGVLSVAITATIKWTPGVESTYMCFVDNINVGATPYFKFSSPYDRRQWMLCKSMLLAVGTHSNSCPSCQCARDKYPSPIVGSAGASISKFAYLLTRIGYSTRALIIPTVLSLTPTSAIYSINGYYLFAPKLCLYAVAGPLTLF